MTEAFEAATYAFSATISTITVVTTISTITVAVASATMSTSTVVTTISTITVISTIDHAAGIVTVMMMTMLNIMSSFCCTAASSCGGNCLPCLPFLCMLTFNLIGISVEISKIRGAIWPSMILLLLITSSFLQIFLIFGRCTMTVVLMMMILAT